MKTKRTTMRARTFLIFCVGALLVPLVVTAQQWRQTGGPEGGMFRTMAPTSNGIVAVFGSGGLYRYQGGNWSRISDFSPTQIIPAGETLIGLARGASSAMDHYRSEDGGVTWERVALESTFLDVVSVVDRVVYAVRGDTLYISHDGLKSMEPISIVPQFMQPPIGRSDFLLTTVGFFRDSLYHSTDGGVTWAPLETDLPAVGTAGRLLTGGSNTFYMLINNTVHRSTDGVAWEPLKGGLPDMLAIDWIVASDEAAFLKLNGGAVHYLDGSTWMPIEIPGYAFNPTLDGDRLLIPTNTGAFSYTVEGNSLTNLSQGLRGMPITALAASSSALFAGGVNGLYRSLDDGESWETVEEAYVYSFETHGETVFAVLDRDILRSTDHGTTWVSMQEKFDNFKIERWGTNEYPLPFSGITIADDGSLYVTIAESFSEHGVSGWRDGGVFRSNDNGETWSEVSAGLPHDGFTYVPVGDAIAMDDGLLLISTLDGVLRSTSRGLGWSRASAGLPTDDLVKASGVFFTLNGDIYLQTSAGLFRANEDATAWEPAPNLPVSDQYWSTYGDHANIVNGKMYVPLSIWNGVTTTPHLFTFDGTTWEDVSDEMPEGVTFQAFTQKGDRVYAGSQWHSIWSKSLASSSVREPNAFVAGVTIAPNPSDDEIVVRLELERNAADGKISVTNTLGETVGVLYEGDMKSGTNEYRFDAARLPAGAYFVRVAIDGSVSESMLIKQ